MTGNVVWICCVFWLPCHGLRISPYPRFVEDDVTRSATLNWVLDDQTFDTDIFYFYHYGRHVFGYSPSNGNDEIYPPSNNYDTDFSITDHPSSNVVGFRRQNLRAEDAGNYTFQWQASTGQAESWAILLVYDVPASPVMTVSPSGDLVDGETSVNLRCSSRSTSLPVTYRPAMLYTWSRNGIVIDRASPPDRHILLGDSGDTLQISPVSYKDATYSCKASESGTKLTSAETNTTLNILYGPLNTWIVPEDPVLACNATLLLKAFAKGNPPCDFRWEQRRDFSSSSSILMWDRFGTCEPESYHVTAYNAYGSTSASVTVRYIPPEIPIISTTTANPTPQNDVIAGVRYDIMAITFGVTTGALLLTSISLLVVHCRLRRLTEDKGNANVVDQQTVDYINSAFLRDATADTIGHQRNDVIGVYVPVLESTSQTPEASAYATLSK